MNPARIARKLTKVQANAIALAHRAGYVAAGRGVRAATLVALCDRGLAEYNGRQTYRLTTIGKAVAVALAA